MAGSRPDSATRSDSGRGNRQEILGNEACTTNQSAANLREGQNRSGISGLYGPAIEDERAVALGAELNDEVAANQGVHVGDLA